MLYLSYLTTNFFNSYANRLIEIVAQRKRCRPTSQSNRVFQILEKKFHKNDEGEISGYGFHLYPLKSEKPQGSP